MPAFRVRLAELDGGVRQVRVVAADAAGVSAALGVPPMRLLSVQAEATAGATATAGRPWRRRGPAFDLRLFSQELAVLLDAGIPLLDALATLREKDSAGRGRRTLDSVMAALREGQPVSAALARVPEAFDALFIALVAASERSGQLAATLRDHAAFLGWSSALQARLRAALVYPAMLLAAGLAVIVFLLLFVLPRFAGVFDSLAGDVPAASRWLMALGVHAAAYPALTLALAAALPLGGLLVWRSAAARRWLDRLMWRSPVLGPRLQVIALARLYRCLGLLLGAGVPAPAALRLLDGVLAAPLRAAGAQALTQVLSGQRLSQAFDAAGLSTPVAQRMLRVGESSGTLPVMLQRAAAFHDEEIAQLADLVTRLVNPLLMLVMGVLIGGIVVLMYLPIFTLMEQVQ
ncbi:type II secretion system F family protein [Aquabacterium sp. OR-4]|uniref:type II secretion system F family protein n=1 Tax=Aquabacterium sp. OR-4 TaxID=2978127 RepID=UPI0028C862D6|nr:type II secretion system F family protein [Aquabacterium sp. OR-4]MDT7838953.1 type II secretion system F family protein [Aquabacterium sp. OR-4]